MFFFLPGIFLIDRLINHLIELRVPVIFFVVKDFASQFSKVILKVCQLIYIMKPHLCTTNIISAMEKYGIKRLVSLTGAGVDDSRDRPKLANHLIKTALKLMSGHVLKDAENHVDVIRKSNLDWVIVRGPMLKDGPHTGNYRIGWVGVNTSSRISRADLADFLLKQATDTTYLGQAPLVSY